MTAGDLLSLKITIRNQEAESCDRDWDPLFRLLIRISLRDAFFTLHWGSVFPSLTVE
jgi:hypothetical protein